MVLSLGVAQEGILEVHRSGLEVETKDESKPFSPKPPVLILLSGFPDTTDTWKDVLPRLETKFHVCRMAYPDMDQPVLKSKSLWGHWIKDVEVALLAVLHKYRDAGCYDLYLLGHDWGSILALIFAHHYPPFISGLILEDVGSLSLYEHHNYFELLLIVSYHLFHAALFFWSRILPFSTWWYRKIWPLYPWNWMGPLKGETLYQNRDMSSAYPHQCYPYLLNWITFAIEYHFVLPFPHEVPCLFLYGKKKRTMYHSQSFLKKMDQHPDDDHYRHVGYEGVGHWPHQQIPQQFADEVMKFCL